MKSIFLINTNDTTHLQGIMGYDTTFTVRTEQKLQEDLDYNGSICLNDVLHCFGLKLVRDGFTKGWICNNAYDIYDRVAFNITPILLSDDGYVVRYALCLYDYRDFTKDLYFEELDTLDTLD